MENTPEEPAKPSLLDGLVAYWTFEDATGPKSVVAFDHVGENHLVSQTLDETVEQFAGDYLPDEPPAPDQVINP